MPSRGSLVNMNSTFTVVLSGNFLEFYSVYKIAQQQKSLQVLQATELILLFPTFLSSQEDTLLHLLLRLRWSQKLYDVCILISIRHVSSIYPASTSTSPGPSEPQLDSKPSSWKPCLPSKHSNTHLS